MYDVDVPVVVLLVVVVVTDPAEEPVPEPDTITVEVDTLVEVEIAVEVDVLTLADDAELELEPEDEDEAEEEAELDDPEAVSCASIDLSSDANEPSSDSRLENSPVSPLGKARPGTENENAFSRPLTNEATPASFVGRMMPLLCTASDGASSSRRTAAASPKAARAGTRARHAARARALRVVSGAEEAGGRTDARLGQRRDSRKAGEKGEESEHGGRRLDLSRGVNETQTHPAAGSGGWLTTRSRTATRACLALIWAPSSCGGIDGWQISISM